MRSFTTRAASLVWLYTLVACGSIPLGGTVSVQIYPETLSLPRLLQLTATSRHAAEQRSLKRGRTLAKRSLPGVPGVGSGVVREMA